jgi:hypothetical protein
VRLRLSLRIATSWNVVNLWVGGEPLVNGGFTTLTRYFSYSYSDLVNLVNLFCEPAVSDGKAETIPATGAKTATLQKGFTRFTTLL